MTNYLRLEQGRDRNPSHQILDALARVMQLDAKASQHLHRLASPTGGRAEHSDVEEVAEALDEVIDQFPMPAIVANRYQDVLAANRIARALSPGFTPGRNFLCWRLLDPAARELYVDWDEASEVAVSGLREVAGPCSGGNLRSLGRDASPRSVACCARPPHGTGRPGSRNPDAGRRRSSPRRPAPGQPLRPRRSCRSP
jgi:MmyB-like transcription regulator ligand binding domain